MPCYHPLQGWYSKIPNKNGKHPVVFSLGSSADPDRPATVPCGRCIGCRLEYSRQWAVRCLHEAHLHDDNCFITLTFDEENLPADHSLDVRTFQLFMKRLRKRFPNVLFKNFYCGEYGEACRTCGKSRRYCQCSSFVVGLGRPHYHACLFGLDFPDKLLYDIRDGIRLYGSDILNDVWTHGFCTIGEVTFESAAYVARYSTKKINGDLKEKLCPITGLKHYEKLDHDTGEIFKLLPEFANSSRGGRYGKGLSYEWFMKYRDQVMNQDSIIINAKEVKVPRYYDNLYKETHAHIYDENINRRVTESRLRFEDNTFKRLLVKERVKYAQLNLTTRGYENEA